MEAKALEAWSICLLNQVERVKIEGVWRGAGVEAGFRMLRDGRASRGGGRDGVGELCGESRGTEQINTVR